MNEIKLGLLKIKEDENLSNKDIAKIMGVSEVIVQRVFSTKSIGVSLDTMAKVLNAIGYKIKFERIEKK